MKPSSGNALAATHEVLPVAADLGDEEPSDPHPEHWRNVLDQRLHAALQAGFCVEAEEAFDLGFVEGGSGAELSRRQRRVQVDREDWRPDRGSEIGTSLDPATRLRGQPVDARRTRRSASSRVLRPSARARLLRSRASVASTARLSVLSSATSRGARANSSPAQGPPSRRSAICSRSGAALSCGMAAEPVDIEGYSFLEGADAKA